MRKPEACSSSSASRVAVWHMSSAQRGAHSACTECKAVQSVTGSQFATGQTEKILLAAALAADIDCVVRCKNVRIVSANTPLLLTSLW